MEERWEICQKSGTSSYEREDFSQDLGEKYCLLNLLLPARKLRYFKKKMKFTSDDSLSRYSPFNSTTPSRNEGIKIGGLLLGSGDRPVLKTPESWKLSSRDGVSSFSNVSEKRRKDIKDN